jgi:ribosomal protein L16 Arg81 hydroxylase
MTTVENGTDSLFTIGHLLSPMPPDVFFRDYYEKQPCIIARTDADHYRGLLSLEVMNEVLSSQILRFPKVKIVNSALTDQPKSDAFTTNGVDVHPARFLKHFVDGCTLVFSSLHEQVRPLGLFCDFMSTYFSHGFQTNIYLTPPNAQGFNPHYDTHDVFILQVAGSKRWRLFDTPIQLPLKSQPFELKRVQPGPVSMEFVLNSGDMLYIPRGLMHDAETTGELSMHITAGLLGYTWQDMLVEALINFGSFEPELRKNLPVGFAQCDATAHEALKKHAASILDKMVGSMDIGSSLSRFSEKLQSDIRPNLPDQFNAIMHIHEVMSNTVVARRPEVHFRLSQSQDKCSVHLFGSNIEFPAFMWPALNHIKNNDEFVISDLPDCVDENGKVTFAKRLIKEGLAMAKVRNPS